MRAWSFGVLAGVLFAVAGVAAPIADSVAGFSATQGLNNWYYGYYQGTYAPSAFQQMTVFDGTWWRVHQTAYWTAVSQTGAHPNGINTSGGRVQVDQWAVRRWVSTYTGTVSISGLLAKSNGTGGDGIVGRIFAGGTEIYSQAIEGTDTTGLTYSLVTNVTAGQTVDFAVDPRFSNDHYDGTTFTATINAAVPEPASFALAAAAVLAFAGLRRRRSRAV